MYICIFIYLIQKLLSSGQSALESYFRDVPRQNLCPEVTIADFLYSLL